MKKCAPCDERNISVLFFEFLKFNYAYIISQFSLLPTTLPLYTSQFFSFFITYVFLIVYTHTEMHAYTDIYKYINTTCLVHTLLLVCIRVQ